MEVESLTGDLLRKAEGLGIVMVSMQWIGHLEQLASHRREVINSAEYVDIVHLRMRSRHEWKECPCKS